MTRTDSVTAPADTALARSMGRDATYGRAMERRHQFGLAVGVAVLGSVQGLIFMRSGTVVIGLLGWG